MNLSDSGATILRKRLAVSGVILAGTHPWSNSAFDSLLPRPLVPVAHRPLISYALCWLRHGGIENVTVCGNRETRLLQTRLVNHVPVGMGLSYLEDPMPRGAAGCVRDALVADDAATFVVADGTSIPNVDLANLLKCHRASGAAATVVVHTEAGGKNRAGLRTPTGIYVFERRALNLVPARGFYDIKEHLIPGLHRSGEPVVTYAASSAVPRVLSSSTYLAVNEWVIEQLIASDDVPDGYIRSGDSLVHSEASIAGDAVLAGPILVGPGARILPGAVVVGPTSIGLKVTIQHGAVVSRSAVWRRAVIGPQANADRCIIADDAVLEGGQQVFRTVLSGRSHSRDHVVTAPSPALSDFTAWKESRASAGRQPVGSNRAAR